MKFTYLGTFYHTESHECGEPYETTDDVMMSDRDNADTYPMDDIVSTSSEWVQGYDEYDGYYQESHSAVLFRHIEDANHAEPTYKAWRVA